MRSLIKRGENKRSNKRARFRGSSSVKIRRAIFYVFA
jgi:hypothetical protein